MLSPKNSDAPNKPIVTMKAIFLGLSLEPCKARAISAIMPPSPLLSARIIKIAYLMVTTIVIAQKIRDKTPNTWILSIVKPP
jgi:hypothetical protein